MVMSMTRLVLINGAPGSGKSVLADCLDVQFFEFVLDLDARALAERLAGRSSAPSRPEHLANNSLVGPGDAALLVKSLESLRETRPGAVWIYARGSLPSTLHLLQAALQ